MPTEDERVRAQQPQSPVERGDALRDLVNDAEARTQLGKHAREWAATRTIEANIHRWEEAYAS